MQTEKENLIYLNTAFAYRDTVQSKTVYHEVNLCFHDKANLNQNYFFAGNMMFYKEWTDFMDNIKSRNKTANNYEFTVIPVTEITNKNKEPSYSFNYDLKLFNNYDGSPIKVYNDQINDHCEVYVGDFFMSRWVFLN